MYNALCDHSSFFLVCRKTKVYGDYNMHSTMQSVSAGACQMSKQHPLDDSSSLYQTNCTFLFSRTNTNEDA